MAILLPSAELQFADANGHPYAGGTLETYVPGTTTPKTTWVDPGGVAMNTQPITLDAAGRCILYGDGQYRLILRDANGVLVWDGPSSTVVSAAMQPVCIAATIGEAQTLLGIDNSVRADLTAETNARIAADNAETTARTTADTLLQEQRDNDVDYIKTADQNLQDQITAEVNRATNAEAALSARIDSSASKVRAGTTTTNGSGLLNVSFSPTFATACVAVAAAYNSTAQGNTIGFSVGSLVVNTSGFYGTIVDSGQNPVTATPIQWYAIGY